MQALPNAPITAPIATPGNHVRIGLLRRFTCFLKASFVFLADFSSTYEVQDRLDEVRHSAALKAEYLRALFLLHRKKDQRC